MSTTYAKDILGKPETITLVMRTRFPKERRRVYCLHCAELLLFTYKKVIMIIYGTASPEEIENEVQCKRCKAIFEIS